MNTLIHDLVQNSMGKDCITQSGEIAEAMRTLRQMMFDNVYKNPLAKKEESKAKQMLAQLYEYYSKHIEKLPDEYRQLIVRGEKKERVVCDYISGMTDQYSIHLFQELFVPKAWAVF